MVSYVNGMILAILGFLLGQSPQPGDANFEPGRLPLSWRTGGPNCVEIPDWQVHEYNADFFILRESGCTHYEKPFLYLVFGADRALLVDTGAGQVDTRSPVMQLIGKWAKRRNRPSVPLLVVHSHGHGDHVAGDSQFRNVQGVHFVEATIQALAEAFQLGDWPNRNGVIELGGRTLDLIPIPGHQEASIALYDRRTGILLTGDTVYPGRLYVRDWRAFTASIERLVAFTGQHPVTHVLGCHIEQSRTPFVDYPVGTVYHPDEHALELGRAELLELFESLQRQGGMPARIALRDMTVVPRAPEAAR